MSSSESSGAPDSSLANGWVPQPDGRGTIDILQDCLISLFLCSWSALFLNVPERYPGLLTLFMHRARWMAFAVAFPEMLTGMAAEQWRSACQSVEDFARLRKQWESDLALIDSSHYHTRVASNLSRVKRSPWTMRHAFFADMGGFLLHCPNVRPFPIDAQQLLYMIENYHLEYPDVSERVIWDRNKADGFARVLTLVQIGWFLIKSLGRVIQQLDISMLELSTLASIFCTLTTFFFWRHKPLDVVSPITLPCSVMIEDVIDVARYAYPQAYSETPLDFVKPPAARQSLVAPFWVGVKVVFHGKEGCRDLPIKSFDNSRTTPPRGATLPDIVFGLFFSFAYFGIHLLGWNFVFPTRIEQLLWRVSSLTLLTLLVIYLLAIVFGTLMASWMSRTFFGDEKTNTIQGVARLLPRWAGLLTHSPVMVAYALARLYIILEGFFSLRTLSATAYDTVEWSKFVGLPGAQ